MLTSLSSRFFSETCVRLCRSESFPKRVCRKPRTISQAVRCSFDEVKKLKERRRASLYLESPQRVMAPYSQSSQTPSTYGGEGPTILGISISEFVVATWLVGLRVYLARIKVIPKAGWTLYWTCASWVRHLDLLFNPSRLSHAS